MDFEKQVPDEIVKDVDAEGVISDEEAEEAVGGEYAGQLIKPKLRNEFGPIKSTHTLDSLPEKRYPDVL